MKKKTAAIVVALCLMAALPPPISQAAVAPHFFAVNDTLLPFSNSTMPYIGGGTILVPYEILSMVGIWSLSSAGFDYVRLYRGSVYVDFFAEQGRTEDQNGNELSWPLTQRAGGKFYVPLHHVCEYFGLGLELIEVGRDVIPNRQIWLIRIISGPALSSGEFIAQNRDDMLAMYNAYYDIAQQSPSSPGDTVPETPTEEPPPDYSDVTIYLSFYDVADGGADGVVEMLDAGGYTGSAPCFFVSADDIRKDPGLMRRLSGGGYMLGLWLDEGTYEEYLEASALLFEAAKIRTVLVSAYEDLEAAVEAADANGLILWPAAASEELDNEDELEIEDDSQDAVGAAMDNLPTQRGERHSLVFPCSEYMVSALPEAISFLNEFNYTVSGINETVIPITPPDTSAP